MRFVLKVETIHLKEQFSFLGENGCDPQMDVYIPQNISVANRPDIKRPCMIVCPGGAYMSCCLRESEPVALQFLQEGFSVFVLRYSVSPKRFPVQLREIAAVMEWIYQHSEKYSLDTNKITIIGFSAGGHLAAHYSTSYDCEEVRKLFPNSKAVNATVLCYPVITAEGEYAHIDSFRNLLGVSHLSEEDIKKVSCEKLVSSKTPPTYIWHTMQDDGVSVVNSLLYAKALADNKVLCELHIFPFGPHGLSTVDWQTNGDLSSDVVGCADWLMEVKGWLRKILELGSY